MTTRNGIAALGALGALVLASLALRNVATEAPSEPEARGRSGTYAFDVFPADGQLHLLLVDYEPSDEIPILRYTASPDGGASWSEPVRVDAGATPVFLPYRGVDPQIAVAGNTLVAVWTTAGEDLYGYGTGPLATAFSSDGGKTWSPGPNPADDGLETAHEFIDISSDAGGRFHLIWIDDRENARGIRRGLRYSRSVDGGQSWSPNQTLEPRICGCCWTHLRVDDEGSLYALFRDEDPAPSDMKLMSSADAGASWSVLGTVGAFGWMQKGCPHTTAGFALGHDAMHALVQTGQEGAAGIYYLVSRDRGTTWSEPVRVAGEGAHYSDLAASGNGLAAIWQGQKGRRTVVFARTSHDGGRTWSETELLSDPATSSSYPRIMASGPGGDSFRIFWIESEDGRRHTWNSVTFR